MSNDDAYANANREAEALYKEMFDFDDSDIDTGPHASLERSNTERVTTTNTTITLNIVDESLSQEACFKLINCQFTNFDIASAMAIDYKHIIKCGKPSKDRTFYVYHSDRRLWVEGPRENVVYLIQSRFSTQVALLRDFKLGQLNKQKQTGTVSDGLDAIVKKLNLFVDKLRDNRFADEVAKSLAGILHADSIWIDVDNLFNTQHELLPIQGNKVVNLRTGEVIDRTKEHMFTFECPMTYNPNAVSPDFDRFINDITLGKPELAAYLQQTSGYACSGSVEAKQAYVLYGPRGNNGKSTYIRLMAKGLGKYYAPADISIITKTTKNSDSYVAALKGKRCVSFPETTHGEYINEGLIKSITAGNDDMSARDLHQKAKDAVYKPVLKAFLPCNNIPECSADPALWKRLVMLPFDCYFTTNPDPNDNTQKLLDTTMEAKLLDNPVSMSAFLNWLIVGARRFFNDRMAPPQIVIDTTEERKSNIDMYQQFLEDRVLITGDITKKIGATVLYNAFEAWCGNPDNEAQWVSQKAFGTKMHTRLECKRGGGGWFYLKCEFKTIVSLPPSNDNNNNNNMTQQQIESARSEISDLSNNNNNS